MTQGRGRASGAGRCPTGVRRIGTRIAQYSSGGSHVLSNRQSIGKRSMRSGTDLAFLVHPRCAHRFGPQHHHIPAPWVDLLADDLLEILPLLLTSLLKFESLVRE